jgi:hypothetical protein
MYSVVRTLLTNVPLQPPLVLKFTRWILPPTVVRSVSIAGIPLVKRSLVASEMVTSKSHFVRLWFIC